MKRAEINKLVLGLLVVIAPFLYKWVEQGVFVLLCITLSGIAIAYSGALKKELAFSWMDLFAGLYIAYGFFNLLYIRDYPVDHAFFAQWFLLVGVYLLARNTVGDNGRVLLYLVIISGVLQASMGILQACEVLPSRHRDYLLTGSFPNPGPYGGFLAVTLLASLTVAVDKTLKSKMRAVGIVISVFLFVMLALANSRAAYLALITGFLYFIFGNIPAKNRNKYFFAVILLLVTLSVAFYYLRTGSADSRLLIWRVCMDVFGDHFLFGSGVASLPAVYMDYQADYFREHPGSGFIEVANNHYQAFNEFVRLASEQGITGLGLFLVILFLVFRSEADRNVKALFVTLLVFSCFSYPSDVLALKLFFPLLIGLSAKGNIAAIKLPAAVAVIPVVLIPVAVYCDGYYRKAFAGVTSAEEPELPYNYRYMSGYTKIKALEGADIAAFRHTADFVFSTSEMLCDMGDIYYSGGKTVSADSCYRKAFHMVPNRILPLFKLFLLYKGTDTREALEYARKIRDFKPGIVTSVSLRAKHQAKSYIEQKKQDHE